jgi:hypothetical protein
MTYEFHAETWHTVHIGVSKHRVASIKEPLPEPLWDPVQLKGELVKIDGIFYTVAGAETYNIPRSPEHPYRKSFALMVV